MTIKTPKNFPANQLLEDETIYSIASFAAYRLDREVGDEIKPESNDSIVSRFSLGGQTSDIELLLKYPDQLQRPLAFISDLLMESHYLLGNKNRSSGLLSQLSDKQLEIMISLYSYVVIHAIKKLPLVATKKASTVPFQCLEDFESCKKAKRGILYVPQHL